MSLAPDDLLREVAESFADAPPPDHIVENPADPEARIIAEALRVRNWKEIPADTLIDNRTALALLTAEAFRYVLPALIKVAVTRYADADTLPLDLVASLTPPAQDDLGAVEQALAAIPATSPSGFEPLLQFYKSGDAERHFLSRISDLSPGQRMAVRHFLEYMLDAHGEDFSFLGPAAALERYWSRFQT